MRYRLVIFDLDGTLADSFPWFLRVMNDVARDFSFRPVQPDDIAALRRSGTRDILKQLGIPIWKLPRIASHMRRMKRESLSEIPLFAGVPETLRTLRQNGVTLALVSSDSEANARAQLQDSASLFSGFACGASLFGKAAKFRRIVDAAGAHASEVITIGDEIRDHDAAIAAGIAFGGVAWGYTDPLTLRARNPALWFDTLADIPRLIGARRSFHSAGM